MTVTGTLTGVEPDVGAEAAIVVANRHAVVETQQGQQILNAH